MDQMYSNAKTKIYRNRDLLLSRARLRANPDNTSPLEIADLSFIVFGGESMLSDGTQIELENAYQLCLDAIHIKYAREKCGYLPSTRAAF
jgi:hypothetical protein